jgi:aminocarboxymuconate-semialdehyde decarboxylase
MRLNLSSTRFLSLYSGKITDIHAHIYPKNYLKELEKRTAYPVFRANPNGTSFIQFSDSSRSFPVTDSFYDLDYRIKEMGKFKITTELLSAINPWTDSFPSPELAVRFSRLINDEISTIVSQYKNERRFQGLATLPLLSPVDAAKELERAIDELGLVGAIIGTNVNGTYLSDERFLGIFEVAQRKRCLLFIHPSIPIGTDKLRDYGLVRSLGYVFDSTVNLVKMAYAGVFDKFPELKLISAHLSGALPYLQGRIDVAWKMFPESKGNLSEPPSNKIRKVLHADTISYSKGALRLASDLIGVERLMFGTDFPFEWGTENARKSVEEAFSDDELRLIYSENFDRVIKF